MNNSKKNTPNHDRILLPYFPRLIYNALKLDGYAERELFAGFDFGADELCDDHYRLSVRQHEQFLLRVFELTDDRHYSLRLIQGDTSSFDSIVSLAAQHCDNVAHAIEVVARYLKIVTRVFSVSVINKNRSLYYAIDLHLRNDDVAYFAIATFALLTDHMLHDATRGLRVIERVDVSFKRPDGFNRIASRYPFAWRFEQANNRIVFAQQYLSHDVQKKGLISGDLVLEMAEKQLRAAEAEKNIVFALQDLLAGTLASPPGLDAVASKLGHSPRSFRRKLANAGTSYQQELDRLRWQFAKQQIHADLPIGEIAYALGYGSVSDFGRAFKKWCGLSPRAYQQSQKAEASQL